ncbi:MAG: M20/M25/M40 family metallo-hydrolase, partial [Spirochaetaceae bacterium]|nr:M20/M25/M40 family metallo-hydrolase [Spirochaetaceae bacterium]
MNDFEKICGYIEKNIATAIELEKILTKIPALAPESGGDGESAKCKALEDFLSAHGIKDFEHFDAPDSRVSSGVRPNLVATIKGKTAKNLWIMSHLDVVPAGEEKLWNTPPFEVVQKDGKLFGRGVEDDQQGAVCSVMAALALNAFQIQPEYTVRLLFVADEEVVSKYGIEYLVKYHKL